MKMTSTKRDVRDVPEAAGISRNVTRGTARAVYRVGDVRKCTDMRIMWLMVWDVARPTKDISLFVTCLLSLNNWAGNHEADFSRLKL